MMDLLEAYGRVAGAWQLPPMRAGAVVVTCESLATAADAERRLRELAPVSGWLQCQSWQGAFERGLPDAIIDGGSLIAAEAVLEDGRSLLLQYDGCAWSLWLFRHQESGEELVDEVTHLREGSAEGLRYRRYWRRDPARGLLQHAACFIGFE